MNDQELKDAIANIYKDNQSIATPKFSDQFKKIKNRIKELNKQIEEEKDTKKKIDLFGYLYKNLWIYILFLFVVVSIGYLNTNKDIKKVTLKEIELDKTFENIEEIKVQYKLGKGYLLEFPERTRIIVKKKLFSDNYIIEIMILDKD